MADDKKRPIIIIKKKVAASHGHHGGAWKVAYADFVTAMMAFFLVMWLMGADEATLANIEKYFTNPGAETPLAYKAVDPRGGEKVNVLDDARKHGGRPIDMPAGKTNTATAPTSPLAEIKELLEETLSLELGVTSLAEQIQLVYDDDGFVLRLAIKDLFKPGTTEVQKDLLPVLNRVGKVLAASDQMVRIEGHADPTESPQNHESLWELSSARAAWVARYWAEAKGSAVDSRRLQITGNAALHPIESSNTANGQAANRRIEIIVLNKKFASHGSRALASDGAEPAQDTHLDNTNK